MAQSIRRPLCQCIGLSSRRQFTQVSPRWAPAPFQPQVVRPASKPEKSLRVLQKEQMAKGVLPSDMGMLDRTFVAPIMKLSSAFKTPTKFLRLQLSKLKYSFLNYGSLMSIKFSSPQAGKRWYNKAYKINRRQVLPKAIALHTEIYTAFAEGDVRKLRELCADGMYESFRARIATRPRGEVLKWELLKYNKNPKVVSDRGAMMPGMGLAVRQAVVRIASQQRLTRLVGGKVVKGSGVKKDLCEYVVVQSQVNQWEEKGWKVWGTTKETTLQDLDDWKKA